MLVRYIVRQIRGAANGDQNSPAPSRRELRREERQARRDGYDTNQYGSSYPVNQSQQGYAYPPNNATANYDYQPTLARNPDSPAPDASHKQTSWRDWIPRLRLIGAVFLPVLLETLDYTVVATAQTNIASQFNSLNLQSYIGTAYVLGSTVFLPIFASIADIFGRHLTMQASVLIFMIGSAISTGATNMPVLLVGRGIAGVGSAGLLALVRIILSDSASLDDNNAQGAMMVILYAVGYAVGPILGGALLKVNWRWIFGINLPISAASMVIMFILLRGHTKGPQPPARLNHVPLEVADQLRAQMGTGFFHNLARLDIVGCLLFIGMGILFLLGLNWGSTESWNETKVIACLVVGAGLLVLFVIWEYLVDHATDHLVRRYNDNEGGFNGNKQVGTRAKAARFSPKFTRITDAMLPLNMFRSYDVVATDYATMVSGMVMLGIFYFVATFYVIVNGSDATHAGVQLLYFAPGMGIGAVVGIRLIKIFRQPKWPCILGAIVGPIGIGLIGQALYNKPGLIKAALILSGAGVGLSFGPLSYQARYSQPEDRVAIVVATNLFFRSAGGTIGLAQLSAVMYSRVRTYITNSVKSGRITLEQASQISQSLMNVGSSTQGGILGLPDQLKTVTTDAFQDGLRWAFFSLLPWMFISFILCLFLSQIDEKRHEKERAEAEAKKKLHEASSTTPTYQ